MKPTSLSIRPGMGIFPALVPGMLLFLATGSSPAADFPAGSAPAATDNAADPVSPATDNDWVDRTHSWIERDMFDTVVWFDRFFGDDRMVVTERPESFLRWMNDLRWDEEERFSFRSTVRASLRLPRLRKRWRIVISGETRGDPNAITPEDPGNPGLDTGSRVRTGSTEVIYDILRTPRSTLDAGAGGRGPSPRSPPPSAGSAGAPRSGRNRPPASRAVGLRHP